MPSISSIVKKIVTVKLTNTPYIFAVFFAGGEVGLLGTTISIFLIRHNYFHRSFKFSVKQISIHTAFHYQVSVHTLLNDSSLA